LAPNKIASALISMMEGVQGAGDRQQRSASWPQSYELPSHCLNRFAPSSDGRADCVEGRLRHISMMRLARIVRVATDLDASVSSLPRPWSNAQASSNATQIVRVLLKLNASGVRLPSLR
jgi:hypothetical protein